MQYLKFNTTNLKHVRKGAATIRLSVKAASCLSKSCVIMTGLKAGEGVGFLKDKDGEWYFVKDGDGFVLRETASGVLHFNSAALVRTVFDDCDIQDDSKTFKVAREPVKTDHGEAWCIIVASGK